MYFYLSLFHVLHFMSIYLHLLHCIWHGCIKSCIEDSSHRFFTCWWFVHNQFVDLGNLFKVVTQYLLVEWMTSLGHRDRVPIVSRLLCMVMYWVRLTMSHDIRLLSSHNFIKLLWCIIFQPWENVELIPKLVATFNYEWVESGSNIYSQ